MELIKLVWIGVFFLFSLTLLFVWSKLYIIAKKAKGIGALLGQIEAMEQKLAEIKPSPAEAEMPK